VSTYATTVPYAAAALEWQEHGRTDDLLVHRDGRLKEAIALIANPRFAFKRGSLERDYLDACIQ